ncbi:DUF177 domain-containing protein [Methylobacterium organophilum]|uniref:YceD family protein n=1 Tax=Methylobacterium organophilum TaxID=410 RepID=UPI001F13D40F|nr:DUF177 domain-containing protein [Methylobacterium organophilum]UMY19058.1 DUF177 domain-containing protein [Methylobacterium organophilum]
MTRSDTRSGPTRPETSPLSRSMPVERLLRNRAEIVVEASEAECVALAQDFGLPAIRGLVGRFRLSGSQERLHVTGSVEALVTQTCTASLEGFEAAVSEPVDITFSDLAMDEAGDGAENVDTPDPITNGRIDFGALTAEFLALGLDPYPRKPGIDFETVSVGADTSPFAALGRLREGEG